MSGWAPIGRVEVTCLPLLDSEQTDLFARLSYADALQVAVRYGARLVSADTVRALHAQALELVPFLGTPTAETDIEHYRAHDQDMWRQLKARGWDGQSLVANCGKHWIDGAPEGRSRLMGWWSTARNTWWQPDAVAHNRDHFDDGTTTMLERDLSPHETPTRETPPAITSPGDHSFGVATWQQYLRDQGYSPGPIDGKHGPMTERATVAWLKDRGLERGDARTPIPAIPPPPIVPHDTDEMVSLGTALPLITFRQAHDYQPGRPFGPPDKVFLHTGECAETGTAAEDLQAWARGDINASWHVAIDNNSIARSVQDEDRAWAVGQSPAHERGLHLELTGRARQSAVEWADAYSLAQRDLATLFIAHWCKRWEIPVRKGSWLDLREGLPGIYGHSDVTRAFPGTTTHQDPGANFPWDAYIDGIGMNLTLL
jgi:hypothetical protein